MEPGERLPCGSPAQPHPAVHQGGWSLRVGPDSGAKEDQLPGRHAAAWTEDGLHEEATPGGGADAGDVDKGGDVCHQGKHCGEVVPHQGSGSAPGHAQIHEHNKGMAGIWIHTV